MSFLENYHTEKELALRLREKTGFGGQRMLRNWRERRMGPPWAKIGKIIIYPTDLFEKWLREQVQQPVRSRRAA